MFKFQIFIEIKQIIVSESVYNKTCQKVQDFVAKKKKNSLKSPKSLLSFATLIKM